MSRRRRARAATGNAMTPQDDVRKLVPDPGFKPVDPRFAKIGWRAYAISSEKPKYGNPPKLLSMNGWQWTPKRKSEAECMFADDHGGVPGEDCSCGFYSAKTLRHLMNMDYHSYADPEASNGFKVVAQVGNWGRVREATQGWRSQFCYPIVLFVPFEVGAQFAPILSEAYGCKIRLLNFLKDPKEITPEFIQSVMDGKPDFKPKAKPKRQGRRVEHKELHFTGRTASESYELDGVKVIDVKWDANPDAVAITPISSLHFEAI